MEDPIVDQMARLRLKLLEKRLENEREARGERGDSALSRRSHDGRTDTLHSALRRKRDLLRRLREQHMLEELERPHTWAGPHRWQRYESFPAPPVPPVNIYQSPPLAVPAATHLPPPPPLPRIIQHTIPQQPATIIQQLPQQQPLIAQIPPPLPVPSRPGSIKEDMVELMLMQNAQMHQIIMHNMMLKALPPMAFSQGASGSPYTGQENSVKARGGSIHHHHHYNPPPPLPPIGYSAWPSAAAYQPSVHYSPGPGTLPALNPMTISGLK